MNATKKQLSDDAILYTKENFSEPRRARALMVHLELTDPEDVEEMQYAPVYGEGAGFEAAGSEWGVLTEDEADAAWDAALDSYLDDCVLPEVPENVRNYFDGEKWKRDARHDGRAHALGTYDGDEHEATDPVSGETFVIYRTN